MILLSLLFIIIPAKAGTYLGGERAYVANFEFYDNRSVNYNNVTLRYLHWVKVMKIEYTSTPESTETNFLTQKINKEAPEFGVAYPFAFFIRDKNN